MLSATTGGEGGGRGHNGGIWEWTSTVWDKYEGFEASPLYPGFSADFFDTYHNAVVSGKLWSCFPLHIFMGWSQRLVGRTH